MEGSVTRDEGGPSRTRPRVFDVSNGQPSATTSRVIGKLTSGWSWAVTVC